MKIDAERRVVVDRMKEYAQRTKVDFPPVASERKRAELELIREKATALPAPRRFHRVDLQTLAKSLCKNMDA